MSIVIVTYNGRHHLERCFSALSQHVILPAEHEVIVVDNASSDGTVSWLRAAYPWVHVIANPENRGFAAGVNDGLRASQGAFVLSLNNDTSCANDFLASLVRFMQEPGHERAGMVAPMLVDAQGRLQASIYREPTLWRLVLEQLGGDRLLPGPRRIPFRYGVFRPADYEAAHEVEWVSGACLLFRRSCLLDIGFLSDETPFGLDDLEIAARARRNGWTVWYVPDGRLTHYRGGTRGADQPRRLLQFVHWSYAYGTRTYLRRYWPPGPAAMAASAVWVGALIRFIAYTLMSRLLPARDRRDHAANMAAAHRAGMRGALGWPRDPRWTTEEEDDE